MDDGSVMKILVATDNHLGYKEKDSVREKDSFTTFEEILVIAKERDVDFVLLGGDLFHENKPSRKSLHSCMEIMRKHCLGSRPNQVEVISDQAVDFGHTSRTITSVNYEDPNLNISIPVFSIHGNHDDPTGSGALSAIDLLSVAGLLNHFGKTTSLESIQISPVLLQKGSTKLALYGLGSVRDERLHRLFMKKKVEFLRPKEDTGDWFNVMVIHQNRAQHGHTNYIPEQFLDDFFDLVIWGHEHECLIQPQWNALKNFFVMQPGSSVATSLSPGESKKKHVAMVSIRGREMKTDAIPLQTVRGMLVEDIVLSQISCISLHNEATAEEEIQRYCEGRVWSLLERARSELTGHAKQPRKPLIRLRIDYTGGYPTFNPHRLGGKFSETVANADSIIHFLKKSRSRAKRENFSASDIDDLVVKEVVDKVRVEDLVEDYLSTVDDKSQMAVLTAKGMTSAVREYIQNKEKDAIYDLCEYQLDKVSTHLKQSSGLVLQQDYIVQQVARYKKERKAASMSSKTSDSNGCENEETYHKILAKVKQNRMQQGVIVAAVSDEDLLMNDEPVLALNKPKRGRGSKSATVSTRGRGRGRGKSAKTKPALPLVEVPKQRKGSGNIINALKAGSRRLATKRVEDFTTVLESDEEETVPTQLTPTTSNKPLKSRGVDFSSDEEHPMESFLAKRKRRM